MEKSEDDGQDEEEGEQEGEDEDELEDEESEYQEGYEPESIEASKRIFNMFDIVKIFIPYPLQNKNGKIELDELKVICKSLKLHPTMVRLFCYDFFSKSLN